MTQNVALVMTKDLSCNESNKTVLWNVRQDQKAVFLNQNMILYKKEFLELCVVKHVLCN